MIQAEKVRTGLEFGLYNIYTFLFYNINVNISGVKPLLMFLFRKMRKKMTKTTIATGKLTKCPACYHIFQMPEKVKLSEVAKCPKCKTLLEVVSQVPLILKKLN